MAIVETLYPKHGSQEDLYYKQLIAQNLVQCPPEKEASFLDAFRVRHNLDSGYVAYIISQHYGHEKKEGAA